MIKRIAAGLVLTVLLLCTMSIGLLPAAGHASEAWGAAEEESAGDARLEGARDVSLQFNGLRAGIITGSFHDKVLAEEMPDSPISQYNSYPDLIEALQSDKIDFFLASTSIANHLVENNDNLEVIPQPLRLLDIGAMFAKTEKGDMLRAQMDEFITRIEKDGTLDEIYEYWGNTENELTPVDMSGLSGENGTLRFATSGTKVPVTFVAYGEIAGTDPDIAVRFCREYGYGIDISIVDTAGIIPGLVTGMYDFSLSDMVITRERKESINFSIPYHQSDLKVVTRRQNTAATKGDGSRPHDRQMSWWRSVRMSFYKTFIRESRWKLFVQGVVTTLQISLLAILFGTVLGFGLYMLCRRGNRAANLSTGYYIWLVKGMPMVVLMLVLYYVVFGKVDISGISVSVIGFTLTFGAAVFGQLRAGVAAVDPGQREAAYALGYSDLRTFFRIILPQALPRALPSYRGEILGLLKGTSVVGYIAVLDLTKMGDIVRSRTYEAFFPLIAVTVIYFVLQGIAGLIIDLIAIRINPRNRKREDILKGIDLK